MYADQDAAIDAILDRHISHGPHEIYPCPHLEGVLHIRSIRPAYTRRRTA